MTMRQYNQEILRLYPYEKVNKAKKFAKLPHMPYIQDATSFKTVVGIDIFSRKIRTPPNREISIYNENEVMIDIQGYNDISR